MTADPTASLPPDAGCDTSDMLLVHGFLRHVYRDAPGLVARVPDGNAQRAAVVADHLAFLNRFLHNHHRTEDLVLWDRLSARSPGCAIHVELMKRQHHRVGELLGRVEPRIEAWRLSGSATQGAQIVDLLEQINDVLFTHLGQEESKILPEVARTWSQKEWDQLGKHARKGVKPREMVVLIGFFFEAMPEGEGEKAMQEAPASLRLMYRLYGRRRFDAYRHRLYELAA